MTVMVGGRFCLIALSCTSTFGLIFCPKSVTSVIGALHSLQHHQVQSLSASTAAVAVAPESASRATCSQCNFTSQFESALLMHRQLYHESSKEDRYPDFKNGKVLQETSNTSAKASPPRSPFFARKSKAFKLPGRTSSATRLFNNLRIRIAKSKMLFSHPEEPHDSTISVREAAPVPSECTSKAMKVDSPGSSVLTTCLEYTTRETFGCHLCSFEADRITVLDRHLLNHHKIGLENLLKLVMAKTKEGLTEDTMHKYGIQQPYYKLQDEIIDDGEFIIETVAPKIKILKHASTNTENNDKFDLEFKAITNEIEKLFKLKQDGGHKVEDGSGFMDKMATLNECMCKFVDSSNTLKMVLNKELDSKANVKEHMSEKDAVFNLSLGGDTPREWEMGRAHSEKMERSRKYTDNSRCDKGKLSAGSFYF